MSDAVTVRPAVDEDRDHVWPLARDLATSYEVERSAYEEAYARAVGDEDVLVLVAEHDGRVVGYLLGQRHHTFHANGTALWVEEVMVAAEHRALGVGRALMAEPKVLMLDEPSLGLAPFLVDEIFDIVRRINTESGVAVLLVEQNAVAALDLVHSAYLIEQGRIVMSGTAEALRANPDIQEAYLAGGRQVDYHAVKHYRRRKRWLA